MFQALQFFLAQFLVFLCVLGKSHLLDGLSVNLLHIYFSFLILKLLLLFLLNHLVLHLYFGSLDYFLKLLYLKSAALNLKRILRDDPNRCIYFLDRFAFCCLLLDASKDPLATLPK